MTVVVTAVPEPVTSEAMAESEPRSSETTSLSSTSSNDDRQVLGLSRVHFGTWENYSYASNLLIMDYETLADSCSRAMD